MLFLFICFQASFLNKLEIENNGETEKLRLLVKEGEERLNKLQEALVDIAKMQLETRKIQVNFEIIQFFEFYHSY